MTPIVTFFNNKGGVGKTSLVYHTAWILHDMGKRVLAVDLDPQANLTSAFLPEDKLEELWGDQPGIRTIFQGVREFRDNQDVQAPEPILIDAGLFLLAGDLRLAGEEDTLVECWIKTSNPDQDQTRSFRGMRMFSKMAQDVATRLKIDIILFDVGPNLGAINRAALVASDAIVVPLAGDLFSIQGLRNLGPTLTSWRKGWENRLTNYAKTSGASPGIELPAGAMKPIGYVLQRQKVRFGRLVQAFTRWLARVPAEYHEHLLGTKGVNETIASDSECLAMFKDYQSLVPLAQDARKPIFHLRAADGALGAHSTAAREASADYRAFAEKLLARLP